MFKTQRSFNHDHDQSRQKFRRTTPQRISFTPRYENLFYGHCFYCTNFGLIGRLVVVIDVNPNHGFWTARLMKVFGHEGKCTCRYNTHGWIVYIMLFPVVGGRSRGSSC